MATRSWLDELAQEAEDGSARLQEMLSVGLGFLRTELGLDDESGMLKSPTTNYYYVTVISPFMVVDICHIYGQYIRSVPMLDAYIFTIVIFSS